jgi:hypothetical protein
MTLPSGSTTIQRGYPHLKVIQKSMRLLYKQLSGQAVRRFSQSLTPDILSQIPSADTILWAQSVAGAIVRHLQLPTGSILINFRNMDAAGRVELTPEDNYLVELSSKYRDARQDVPAILAHEVMHVFLHRHGIRFADTLENEILTDTAAIYLGVGWLCLNAYRINKSQYSRSVGFNMTEVTTTTMTSHLGYLTPDEMGYVLAMRTLALEDRADTFLTSKAAKDALRIGYRQADWGFRGPPLIRCRWWRWMKYRWRCRYIYKTSCKSGLRGVSRLFEGYQFEVSEKKMQVIFACPVCCQKLRLPTGQRTEARCGTCGSAFKCRT